MTILVRDACTEDRASIVEFNARLAFETEQKTLDLNVLSRGVDQALDEPDRLRYWVAFDSTTGRVVGQVGITREWSDWRNGWIWWLQSVYVDAEFRSQGVFRGLFGHVRNLARSTHGVLGLRLYVESANHGAKAAYKALGFIPGGYEVYEDHWISS